MAIEFIIEGTQAESFPWKSLDDPGCFVKVLGQNPETGTVAGYFKMDPHSEASAHSHPSDEFDFVLEGEVEVGGKTYGPGTLFHRQAGVVHGPHVTREKGVLIFASFAGPSGSEKKLGLVSEE